VPPNACQTALLLHTRLSLLPPEQQPHHLLVQLLLLVLLPQLQLLLVVVLALKGMHWLLLPLLL
jgi:hypothetical protein